MVPGVVSFLAGLSIVFLAKLSPVWLLLALPAARVVGTLLVQFGCFFILSPIGLVRLAGLVSHFSGYGIFHAAACVVLWMNFGWPAVALWFGGTILAVVGSTLAEFVGFRLRHRDVFARREAPADRMFIGSSELYFLHAYRLHADRLGVTRSLALDPRELEKNLGSDPNWLLCVYDLFGKWPVMAERIEIPDAGPFGLAA